MKLIAKFSVLLTILLYIDRCKSTISSTPNYPNRKWPTLPPILTYKEKIRNENFGQEPSTLNNVDKWSVTKINLKKQMFSWTIINYSFNGKGTGKYIESPVFSDNSDSDYKWRLKLYPNGYYYKNLVLVPREDPNDECYYNEDDNNENCKIEISSVIHHRGYLSLHLFLELPSDKTLTVTSKFALLKNNTELYFPIPPYVGTISYSNNTDINNYYNRFIESSFVMDKFNNLLPDDKLTIVFEIAINIGETQSTRNCGSPPEASNEAQTDKLETILENELFTDITFKVDDHEFKAHRAILASVSPVLLDEFKNLQSSNETTLTVDKVEPKLFKEILRFAYTGKVEKIEKNAKKLLPIAQQYNITQLKNICERALCQDLNSDNAMDLLQLATNSNATYLKVQALKYITTHAKNMIDTPSFVALISEPQNLISVIRALVDKSSS